MREKEVTLREDGHPADKKKQQLSYYNRNWSEHNTCYYQPDIAGFYDYKQIHATILTLLEAFGGSSGKILEIGVGKGDLALKIFMKLEHREMRYVGIDISEEGVKIAQQKASDFSFLIADGIYLPFKSQQFDIIICSEVIEHIIGKERVLFEISRVLLDEGILILTTPNPSALNNLLPKVINKIRGRYSSDQPVEEQIKRRELADMLKGCSYEVLSHTGLICRPYTVAIFERRLHRPLVMLRGLFEYLGKHNLFGAFGLYQFVVARNARTLKAKRSMP